jgi:hypothetical protein
MFIKTERKKEKKNQVLTRTSKELVPVIGGWPKTIEAEGLRRLSKSPKIVASVKIVAVVSYEAFRNGETLFDRPDLLNGLYLPSDVCTHT